MHILTKLCRTRARFWRRACGPMYVCAVQQLLGNSSDKAALVNETGAFRSTCGRVVCSALHAACCALEGREAPHAEECVKLLLAAGAKADLPLRGAETLPLVLCLRSSEAEAHGYGIAKLLLRQAPRSTRAAPTGSSRSLPPLWVPCSGIRGCTPSCASAGRCAVRRAAPTLTSASARRPCFASGRRAGWRRAGTTDGWRAHRKQSIGCGNAQL